MPHPSASRDHERGHLAPAQRALREVPQRPLTAARLVDREHLVAVRPRPSTRNVAFDDHAHPARRRSTRRRREHGAQRRSGVSSTAGSTCPVGSIGNSQSGQGGRPTRRPPPPRAPPSPAPAHGSRRSARRSPRRAGSSRSLRRLRRTRAARSSTSSRSGSKPRPMSRARNSGTAGSRSWRLGAHRARRPAARGTRRRSGRGTRPPRCASSATCSFSTSTVSACAPFAPGCRTTRWPGLAHRAGARARRRRRAR